MRMRNELVMDPNTRTSREANAMTTNQTHLHVRIRTRNYHVWSDIFDPRNQQYQQDKHMTVTDVGTISVRIVDINRNHQISIENNYPITTYLPEPYFF